MGLTCGSKSDPSPPPFFFLYKPWVSQCLIGNPRYFPKEEGVNQNSKILQSSSLVLGGIFGEKKTRDFSTLTFCPDKQQKVSRTSLTALQFFLFALANNTRSFAKNKWEKAIPPLEALTRSHSSHFSTMKALNTSIHNMKR